MQPSMGACPWVSLAFLPDKAYSSLQAQRSEVRRLQH